MKVGKSSPFASHAIQVRSRKGLGTKRTDVCISHVINEDHNNVREFSRDRKVARQNAKKQKQAKGFDQDGVPVLFGGGRGAHSIEIG